MTQGEIVNHNLSMFDSPYLAENYDLFCEDFYETQLRDVAIYWDALVKARASRRLPDRFTVLDIGTGTGRILNAFAIRAAKTNSELHPAEFIGLDISAHMIDRAAEITAVPKGCQISWALGSALDLESALRLSSTAKKVDFMFFTTGSFSRLCEPGQPEQFFSQVAKVLQPGSGRACISILNSLMIEDHKEATIAIIKAGPQLPSKKFPNIVYQTDEKPGETRGRTHIDKRDILVIQIQEDGQQRILERNCIMSEMRLWNKLEFIGMAQTAGLQVVDIIPGQVESYYHLQVSE